jgi:hypothetical protein
VNLVLLIGGLRIGWIMGKIGALSKCSHGKNISSTMSGHAIKQFYVATPWSITEILFLVEIAITIACLKPSPPHYKA